MRVLFVCLGNICRSPTAEGVARGLAESRGLDGAIEFDSAGTAGWHSGSEADERSRAAASVRGFELTSRARRVEPEDFERFDLLVAMDSDNQAELISIAPDADAAERVRMLREFDPASAEAGELDVPDPYYGGADGFEHVLDVVETACEGLLDELEREL